MINSLLCVFFREGSVIADVDLNFAENATDVTRETLLSELPDSGEMGNLTYDPQSAEVKGAYFRESLFPRDSEDLLLR